MNILVRENIQMADKYKKLEETPYKHFLNRCHELWGEPRSIRMCSCNMLLTFMYAAGLAKYLQSINDDSYKKIPHLLTIYLSDNVGLVKLESWWETFPKHKNIIEITPSLVELMTLRL